jgi:PKD repeat protein
MRHTRVLSLLVGAALLTACGDDNGTGPQNQAPDAAFTFGCTNLTCDFADQSSDTDGTIATHSWVFGDAQTATGSTPSHTFAAAGTYNVTLTVTDNEGDTDDATQAVTVTAPVAGGPVADFDVTCSAANCVITNNTTGATGSVVTWAWDFGNGQISTEEDPTPVQYTVNDVTAFTITLIVTSDGVVSQATRQITVSPAATLTCNGAACTLGIEEDATVVVTMVSHDCQAQGNTFLITQPEEEVLFTDGCFAPVAPDPGSSFTLNSGAAYGAGTQLAAEVRSGFPGAENPQLRVSGNFTDGWTLEFDDGYVAEGEPDFNDLVLTVKATSVP